MTASRTTTLRRSFDAAMADPKLRADAAKLKLDIALDTGEEIERLVHAMIDTPKDIIAKATAAIEAKSLVKKELAGAE